MLQFFVAKGEEVVSGIGEANESRKTRGIDRALIHYPLLY
jgi:hypothetical protein